MRRLALAAAALAACSGASKKPVAGQPAVYVQPQRLDPSTARPANFACLHQPRSEPDRTTASTLMLNVIDFEMSTPVAGATVELFLTVDHARAGTPDATAPPSDADGHTTITVPPGPFRVHYRTTADPLRTVETFEFNRRFDDPKRLSVSQATKGEIPAILSLLPDDTKGVVAGSQRDCDEVEVGGVVTVTQPTTGGFDSAANTFYFIDAPGNVTAPARGQMWTAANGAFATLNLPPGDVQVAPSGLLTAGGALMPLGQAVVPVRANSLSIVQVEPE
jgi:hypothetical protein